MGVVEARISGGGVQNFLSAGSIAKVVFSDGSASTKCRSIGSCAGRFADLIIVRRFYRTVANRWNPTTCYDPWPPQQGPRCLDKP